MIRLRIIVSGKVQKVGFRYAALNQASGLNITGFVLNNADGTVSLEAEGPEADVQAFADWCRRGPAWAEVTSAETDEIPLQGSHDFVIIR
jgi:acylphosphatase